MIKIRSLLITLNLVLLTVFSIDVNKNIRSHHIGKLRTADENVAVTSMGTLNI